MLRKSCALEIRAKLQIRSTQMLFRFCYRTFTFQVEMLTAFVSVDEVDTDV